MATLKKHPIGAAPLSPLPRAEARQLALRRAIRDLHGRGMRVIKGGSAMNPTISMTPTTETRRAEIEQMRRAADYLDLHGEGASAANLRRAADHHERLLSAEIALQNEEIEGDEDDYGLAAMVSNCPCGRSFKGVDFDYVCPSCRVTLREAWRARGTRPLPASDFDDEADTDPFADYGTAESSRDFGFYHARLAL